MEKLLKKKKELMEKIIECSDMIKGSLGSVCGTCRRANCICKHKPATETYRLTYKDENQKSQIVYVPNHLVKNMKKRIEAFNTYRKITGEIIKLNIEFFKMEARSNPEKKK